VTIEEFQQLVLPFEAAFQAYLQEGRLDLTFRTTRV